MAQDDRAGCIFVDIDGTVARHQTTREVHEQPLVLLPGTREIWDEWVRRGFKVVVTTGRRESLRRRTEEQLAFAGVQYDQLVMGCGTGPRVLYNDLRPGDPRPMAYAVNVPRNAGLVPLEEVFGEVTPGGR